VRLETEAKIRIQEELLHAKFELVWSYILEAENRANPFEERKREISAWKRQALVKIEENPEILAKAKQFIRVGLREKDALHISCAIAAACKYFLTTDDKILNKSRMIEEIAVIDPLEFIKEVYP
jgi:predicted nucleic acid-binding protein